MDLIKMSAGHGDHDVAWSVVSPSCTDAVCIACLIQHLEHPHLTSIHRRLIISIFISIIKENQDIHLLFAKNILVARHLIDIMMNIDDVDVSAEISVCQILIEKLECEELVLYLLDKTEWLIDNTDNEKKLLPYLLLLGQLLAVSPVYASILIQTHAQLVEKLVYMLVSPDQKLESCLLLILVHVYESELRDLISTPVHVALVNHTLELLNSVQDLHLQLSVLDLLQQLLKNRETSSMVQTEGKALINGLKKIFVTKQEVLQTAGTVCVVSLMSTIQHDQVISDILDSDLTEFLFESLHTQSAKQIECVMMCLQKMTEYDLFFTRCHAVYGIESLLLAIGSLLAMKNMKLLEIGYSLLVSFLQGQPKGIPLFVNTSTLTTCMTTLQRGIQQHHKPISIQGFRGCAAFFREQYLPASYVYRAVETLLTDLQERVFHINMDRFSQKTGAKVGRHGEEEEEMMALFVTAVSAAARLIDHSMANCSPTLDTQETCQSSRSDNPLPVYSLLIDVTSNNIIPIVMVLYEKRRNVRLIIEHCDILLTVFKLDLAQVKPLNLQLLTCGWLIQLLDIKSTSDLSNGSEKISLLLVMCFQQLMELPTMPTWFVCGLQHLQLPEVVSEVAIEDMMRQPVEALLASLVVLYYSYLYDHQLWSAGMLTKYLETFLANQTDLKSLPSQCVKSLVFLFAWLSSDGSNCRASNNCTKRMVDVLCSSPFSSWYTHHHHLLTWCFSHSHISDTCAANILEMWLKALIEETERIDDEDEEESYHGGNNDDKTTTKEEYNLCKIFFNYPVAPLVLMDLIVSTDESASDASSRLTLWLVNKFEENDVCKIERMTKHCTELFQQVVRLEPQPDDFQILNVLKTLTAFLSIPRYKFSITSRTVQSLYHVVKMMSTEEDIEGEKMSVYLDFIIAIIHHKSDLGHLGVTPMLTQSQEFMSKLEEGMESTSWNIKHKCLLIVTWLAVSPHNLQVTNVIRIKSSYVLKVVARTPAWCVIPSLRLLTIGLSAPANNGPVQFYRENSVVADQLFTRQEIRQVMMYLQQFMCQEDVEVLEHCTDCLKAIFSYCHACKNGLDKDLLNHPWNQALVDTLIEINYENGLSQALVDLLILLQVGDSKVSLEDDILVTFLQSILHTSLTSELTQSLQHLLTKVRKSSVDPRLLKDVEDHLAAVTL